MSSHVRATLPNKLLALHSHTCLTNNKFSSFLPQKKRKSSVEPDHLYKEVFGCPRRDARFFGWCLAKLKVKDLSLSASEAGPFLSVAASSEDPAG